MNNINRVENLILVRNEPHIYAFSTNTMPNYLKVGDTFRPVDVRIEEWNKKISRALGSKVKVKLTGEFTDTAVIDDAYFRDYSVHSFLKDALGKQSIDVTDPDLVNTYSREFFKNVSAEDVEKAVSHIRQDYKSNSPEKKYTYYKLSEKKPADFHWNHDQHWELRPNQSAVVSNFLAKRNESELLMYAVMRFGKSFTAMYCALATQAKKVLIVSAKADVASEWKATVEKPDCFHEYKFLMDTDFIKDKNAIRNVVESGNKAAVFLTLQNLSGKDKDGLNIKQKLAEVFATEYDLIIVDETHFGAWAENYGKALKKEEDADTIKDDLNLRDKFNAEHAKLKTRQKLHLSGTPYNLLYDKKFDSANTIATVQFRDILTEKEAWDREHFEDIENGTINPATGKAYQEFDNPYFGFPRMLRFAFNPTAEAKTELSRLSKTGKWTLTEMFSANENGQFRHEEDVLKLLKIIDGSNSAEGILSFLDIPKIKEHDVCKHMVFVLPYKSSCDAMSNLLSEHQEEFINLCNYKVLNIAGHKSPAELSTAEKVKQTITNFENSSQKTITLTVNKMLTGVTVREWDTMIMLKNTHSAQEYDQAVFRIQNQYIIEYEAPDGSVIKKDMKPQTILVDFDPMRIFEIQGMSANIVNAVSKRDESFEDALCAELKYFPIVTYNGTELVEVEANNIVGIITQYNNQKSILDEAGTIKLDPDILSDEYVKLFIKAQDKSGLTNALITDAHQGPQTDIKVPEPEKADPSVPNAGSGNADSDAKEKNKEIKELNRKFRMCMANILFYVFLSNSKIESLNDIISSLKEPGNSGRNKRIFNHLKLDIEFIRALSKQCRIQLTIDINNKIRNANLLSGDTNLTPEKRASNALDRFSRISDSEVVTPQWICKDMLNNIGVDELVRIVENGGKILDIASKTGEFAYSIFELLKDKVNIERLKNSIYSIPTSGVTYEFTRRMYEVLGLNLRNLADVDNITSYDLIKMKTPDGNIDYDRINRIIRQNKSFNTISANDQINEEDNFMNFDVIIGNPPYQEETAQQPSTTNGQAPRTNIFQYFQIIADKIAKKYSSMIYPGARWIHQAGKGMQKFGLDQINDNKLERIDFYPISQDIFKDVAIADGLTIVLKNNKKTTGGFTYVYHKDGIETAVNINNPGANLIPLNPQNESIIDKVDSVVKENRLQYLHSRVMPRSLFGIESNFVESNPDTVREFSTSSPIDYSTEIKLFTNDKAGKKGRAKWYIANKNVIAADNQKYIYQWQVVVSSANAGGQKRDNQISIMDNHSAFGRSRVALASFATEQEAKNFYQYAQSAFARFMFLMTDESLSSLGKKVPDLLDYSNSNRYIDFSNNLDSQLYSMFGLSEEEINFIEKAIKPME